MDKGEFIERIEKYPYPSMKFTYIENYFNKFGYDLFVYRPTNSDEALLQVFTQDTFRTLIDSYPLEIRDDINNQLIEFFERFRKIAEKYEENRMNVRSRIEIENETVMDVDGREITIDEGQFLIVGEKKDE